MYRHRKLDSMAEDIVEKLADLLEQAGKEKSYYYVASCCREAIFEIERLRNLKGGKDPHLANIVRQVREELQGNNAVRGYMRMRELEEYLKRQGYIP